MKRFAVVLLATSAMSALAFQPASAADLPPPRPAPVVKAPVVVPPPVYNWTGFYIGIHGGGAWARKKWEDTDTTSCIPVGQYSLITGACGDQGSHTAKGPLVGGQAGFNYQAGNFVFGIEGQWSWSNLKGSNSVSVGPQNFTSDGLSLLTGLSTRVRDLGSIAGRLGVVVGASGAVLLFVKGGAGFADDKFTATDVGTCKSPLPGRCHINPDFVASWSGTQFRWGWMVGGGAEVKLTQNVSLKAEYNFIDLGRRDVTLAGDFCTGSTSCTPATSTTRTFSIDQNVHLFKVGINYLFSTR